MTQNQNILLTGGSGFIGTALNGYLSSLGYNVLSPDFDITNYAKVDSFFEINKVDIVLHFAAISNPRYCEEKPNEAFKVNTDATLNLFKASEKSKVSDFIFSSTAHVYESTSNAEPLCEKSFTNPSSVYAKSKLSAEENILKIQNNVRLTTLRLFNHSHMSQTGDFFLPKMVSLARKAKKENTNYIFEKNSLENKIDLSSIHSLLFKIKQILQNEKNYDHEAFNICSGKLTKLKEIVSWVAEKHSLSLDYDSDDNHKKNSVRLGDNRKFQHFFSPKDLTTSLKDQLFLPLPSKP